MPSSPRPLVSLALAFAAGVLLAATALPLVAGVVCCEFASLLLFWVSRKARWKAYALTLAFALLGCARWLIGAVNAPDDAARLAPRFVTLRGMVASEVSVQPARYRGGSPGARFVLRVEAAGVTTAALAPASGDIETRVPLAPAASAAETGPGQQGRQSRQDRGSDGRQARTSGSQEVTRGDPADDDTPRPRYGDTLTVWGRLEPPLALRNPGGFNYAAVSAAPGHSRHADRPPL